MRWLKFSMVVNCMTLFNKRSTFQILSWRSVKVFFFFFSFCLVIALAAIQLKNVNVLPKSVPVKLEFITDKWIERRREKKELFQANDKLHKKMHCKHTAQMTWLFCGKFIRLHSSFCDEATSSKNYHSLNTWAFVIILS